MMKKPAVFNSPGLRMSHSPQRNRPQRPLDLIALDSTYNFIDSADLRPNFDALSPTISYNANIRQPTRAKSVSRHNSPQRRHQYMGSPQNKLNETTQSDKSQRFRLELQRWILDKQQTLNQIYGNSNKRDLERIYGIRLPSETYAPASSLYVLQNEENIVIDGSKQHMLSPSKVVSTPKRPENSFIRKNMASVNLYLRKEVKYPELKSRLNESVEATLGKNEAPQIFDFTEYSFSFPPKAFRLLC